MNRPILYIFAGLPASGKSTLAQELAKSTGATFLRIDSVEQGLRDLCSVDVKGEGYRLSYLIASDNLKLGNSVIADSCNPIELTRSEWEKVALDQKADFINIEVICTDQSEHKIRVENRKSEIAGLTLPSWKIVQAREYDPWHIERIVIDTANRTVESCVQELLDCIEATKSGFIKN